MSFFSLFSGVTVNLGNEDVKGNVILMFVYIFCTISFTAFSGELTILIEFSLILDLIVISFVVRLKISSKSRKCISVFKTG